MQILMVYCLKAMQMKPMMKYYVTVLLLEMNSAHLTAILMVD